MSAGEPRDVVAEKLPKSWSRTKKDKLSDEILDALSDAGLLAEEIAAVEVINAMLPVETIEAFGLTIKLDAMGEASEVSHPNGLVTL